MNKKYIFAIQNINRNYYKYKKILKLKILVNFLSDSSSIMCFSLFNILEWIAELKKWCVVYSCNIYNYLYY